MGVLHNYLLIAKYVVLDIIVILLHKTKQNESLLYILNKHRISEANTIRNVRKGVITHTEKTFSRVIAPPVGRVCELQLLRGRQTNRNRVNFTCVISKQTFKPTHFVSLVLKKSFFF